MQMMRAKCSKCQWSFDVVTAPMPVTQWAKAMQAAHCPMCGNQKGNTLDTPRGLTDRESAHKRALVGELDLSDGSMPERREAPAK